MAKKKLQIFVSSTFLDLEDERGAAVEAILKSKHIPAGMELFKAGNSSQLETIKKWIDESDLYMLILGGRYGSIEPTSGKSYTQLEYEYALEKGIPVFAVILSDKALHQKAALKAYEVFENDNKDKYQEFKEFVQTKIIKYVDDCKDIQIAIKDSISELEEDYDLIGWIRSNEGDTGQLLQQLNETRQECDKFKTELEEYRNKIAYSSIATTLCSGEEKTKLNYRDLEFDYDDDDDDDDFEVTWDELFIGIGIIIYNTGSIVSNEIKTLLNERIAYEINSCNVSVNYNEVIRVQIQLEKLNLIKRSSQGLGFVFTEQGREEFYNKFVERKY